MRMRWVSDKASHLLLHLPPVSNTTLLYNRLQAASALDPRLQSAMEKGEKAFLAIVDQKGKIIGMQRNGNFDSW